MRGIIIIPSFFCVCVCVPADCGGNGVLGALRVRVVVLDDVVLCCVVLGGIYVSHVSDRTDQSINKSNTDPSKPTRTLMIFSWKESTVKGSCTGGRGAAWRARRAGCPRGRTRPRPAAGSSMKTLHQHPPIAGAGLGEGLPPADEQHVRHLQPEVAVRVRGARVNLWRAAVN